MIPKEIINYIEEKTNIKARPLIEKDILLGKILSMLVSEKSFFENYAFKGGTCLIKCYLGYYRFSEDLDFTYVNSKEFGGKSENQIRKIISEKIDKLALIIDKVAKSLGLSFKPNKEEREFIEFGGSNAFVTFKLWYHSEELQKDTFIKVQINYRENLNYPIVEKRADNILLEKHNDSEEELFLLPESSEWIFRIPKVKCYDIREILTEKIRAILTRRGSKARDFIDVYMITKAEKINLEELRQKIIDKTEIMLKFEKYKVNLSSKQESGFPFSKEEEKDILLIKIHDDFDAFLDKFRVFLKKLIEDISKDTESPEVLGK